MPHKHHNHHHHHHRDRSEERRLNDELELACAELILAQKQPPPPQNFGPVFALRNEGNLVLQMKQANQKLEYDIFNSKATLEVQSGNETLTWEEGPKWDFMEL